VHDLGSDLILEKPSLANIYGVKSTKKIEKLEAIPRKHNRGTYDARESIDENDYEINSKRPEKHHRLPAISPDAGKMEKLPPISKNNNNGENGMIVAK